ncbi:MAG: 2-oxo-4-hydroxy-4-carboxy-5-ureidoimidazoline decarboxylase [Alphaproteobacteria bacterium]
MPQGKPSRMTRAEFIETFGHVFERSAWVAERAWENGLDESHDNAEGLHAAMAAAVDDASNDEKRDLLLAHPDLAGRLAVDEALTPDSAREQGSAGLDRCSPQEFRRFQELNAAYRERFGFPFIMAVKGSSRPAILAAFELRLGNEPDQELATATDEVKKIALLRLRDLLP